MTTIWKRSTEDATTPRRARLATLALLLGLLSLTISMLGASKSAAAPGDPFDPLTPYVFIGQESPTSLYRAVAGAGGTVTFSPEGSASGVTYNAIGYDTGTNYIYGVAITGNAAIPTGSVIRIGQGGVVTRVGSTVLPGAFYWGAMGSGNRLYVGNSNSVNFTVINTLTGAVESTGTLASGQTVFDLTYAQGYFWGVNNDGDLVRVDLESTAAAKPVSVFSLGMAAGPYGATWTFGNGNIGISNNGTGLVTQIAITNPGSANPTRTIVATSPGPSSSNNDGAASPGGPTDLSIVKTAPTSFDAGGTLTYSVKVTNNGPSISTGSIVTDLVPAGLTGVQTSTPGCTVLNNRVTCTVGQLTAGASSTITITADTPSTVDKCYTNAASVLANELDPTPDNNSSSVTSCPRALAIEKSSDATTATRIGDTITYTVTATNTGLGSYTLAEPAVLVDDLSGILDDAIYNDDATATVPGLPLDYTSPKLSWTGPLAPGKSVSVTYTAVTQAGGDGVMRNVAFQPTDPTDPVTPECAPPTAAGLDPVTGQPCAQVVTGLPSLTIAKTADRTSVVAIGQTITYSYLITNTGGTTLAPVTVTETAFSGTGTAPTPTCPAGAASLAPGASVTCTATYVTTEADVNSGAITNTAIANGTPPGGPPVESPPSRVTIVTPGPPPPLTIEKSSDATTATRIGDTITYTVTATNTGLGSYTTADPAVLVDDLSGILDDAVYNDDATASRPGQLGYSAPKVSWTGPLGAGQSVTVTYTAETKTGGDGVMRNVAFQPTDPTDPVTPECAPPTAAGLDSATGQPCAQVTTGLPSLTIAKTADRTTVAAVGETITYSYLITNTGGTTLAPVTVTETAFSGTGTVPVPTCPTAASSLAPGQSVTCSASYTATQADVNSGAITNTAIANGTPPGGPPVESPPSSVKIITPGPPIPAVPHYDLLMLKSASRGQVTVGDSIAYKLLVKNLGPDAADGVRVTDTAPSQVKVQSAKTPQGACAVKGNKVDCAVGKLDSGQSVTVTVLATAIRSGNTKNTAVAVPPVLPPGTTPVDPPGNNRSTVSVRIVKPQLRVSKQVDRTTLRAGQTATYTVRVTNPSRRAVRNVRTCDRLPSGLVLASSKPTAKLSRGQHCWTTKILGPGKSVTYRITVRALRGTSGRKTNVVEARSPDARRGRATRSVRVVSTAVKAGGVTG